MTIAPPARTLIPGYEVRAFLDEAAPGLTNVAVARILDVDKNTVSRWLKDGMPVPKARELIAWRAVEFIRL